jgi:hypothetical protein
MRDVDCTIIVETVVWPFTTMVVSEGTEMTVGIMVVEAEPDPDWVAALPPPPAAAEVPVVVRVVVAAAVDWVVATAAAVDVCLITRHTSKSCTRSVPPPVFAMTTV